MIKNILFVADPLSTFKIYKDSTYVMMREFFARGIAVWACEPKDIFSLSASPVSASMQCIQIQPINVSSGSVQSEWFHA